jgi:hypothetical protein
VIGLAGVGAKAVLFLDKLRDGFAGRWGRWLPWRACTSLSVACISSSWAGIGTSRLPASMEGS